MRKFLQAAPRRSPRIKRHALAAGLRPGILVDKTSQTMAMMCLPLLLTAAGAQQRPEAVGAPREALRGAPFAVADGADKDAAPRTADPRPLRCLRVMETGESANTPLPAGQKFRLFLSSATDPFVLVGTAVTAGIGQARDSHKGYGQGVAGYAKRYGAALADKLDAAFWGKAVLPSLLREDPRYFRRGRGSLASRALYAFMSSFIAHTDAGTRRFNLSSVAGNLIAGGVSNSYYPKRNRGISLTFANAAIVTLAGTLKAEAREFWPDIRRRLAAPDCPCLPRRSSRRLEAEEGEEDNHAQVLAAGV